MIVIIIVLAVIITVLALALALALVFPRYKKARARATSFLRRRLATFVSGGTKLFSGGQEYVVYDPKQVRSIRQHAPGASPPPPAPCAAGCGFFGSPTLAACAPGATV
jgi:hypothetical protein